MTDRAQAGQALAEALVVLGVLGSFWIGIGWLGQLQDIRQQLDHASRHAAFAHAHQGQAASLIDAQVRQDLSGRGNLWNDRMAQARVDGPPAFDLDPAVTPVSAQTADPMPMARALRTELRLGDTHPWLARVSITTGRQSVVQGRLLDFDQLGLAFHRHTAIAAGAGDALADVEVQETLAASTAAWRSMAERSQAAGQAVAQRMVAVDQAWGRANPGWDWLSSWAGQIPAQHLEAQP